MKTLTPPSNSKEAIQSRRNPCCGIGVATNLQEHHALASLLTETGYAIFISNHPLNYNLAFFSINRPVNIDISLLF